MSYELQFCDGARFMASSLSNPVSNIAERIHNIKCKYRYDNKKIEKCGIKYNDWELNIQTLEIIY